MKSLAVKYKTSAYGRQPIKLSFILLLLLLLFYHFFFIIYLNNLDFDADLFCRNKELRGEVAELKEAAKNKTREVPFLSSIFLTFELQ